MKEKLPRVEAVVVISALEKKGFILVRQSGSHKIFRNDQGVRVTVPCHAGQILHPKILRAILTDADLSFNDL